LFIIVDTQQIAKKRSKPINKVRLKSVSVI
jgi:hypothetical protein